MASLQGRRRQTGARATGGCLLAAGQIRRRPARCRTALPRRGRRPDLLRADGPDRRDRALRARARDQVRDLRDDPDPRRDHRRAALARLGAALGPLPRARDRGCPGQARARAAAGADRGRAGGQGRPHRGGTADLAAGDRQLLDLRARRALDDLRLLRRLGLAARHDLRPARRRPAGIARQQRDQGPPHRVDRRRCPSASSSSSPSTTTRTSPCARSARCSASPSRASRSCTPRP